MKRYIYLLKDGESIFYIGQTKNVGLRLRTHISSSRLLKNDKDVKIKGMLNDGRMPILETIAECTEEEANEMEASAILEHQGNGCPLVNSVITRAKRIIDYKNKRLHPREMQILKLIAADLTTEEIASETLKSVRTIETIRQSIRKKMQANTFSCAIAKAFVLGYLSVTDSELNRNFQ